jgi:hypothetical protein
MASASKNDQVADDITSQLSPEPDPGSYSGHTTPTAATKSDQYIFGKPGIPSPGPGPGSWPVHISNCITTALITKMTISTNAILHDMLLTLSPEPDPNSWPVQWSPQTPPLPVQEPGPQG